MASQKISWAEEVEEEERMQMEAAGVVAVEEVVVVAADQEMVVAVAVEDTIMEVIVIKGRVSWDFRPSLFSLFVVILLPDKW